MAKLSPDAKAFYKPHFSMVSWIFMLCTTIPLDALKTLIDFVPGVDLIDFPISIAAFLGINLYFLIKLGPSYLGGEKSGQKIFITFVTAVITWIPILDGLVPDEAIDAAGLMWAVGEEDKENANKAAADAAKKATQKQRVQQVQYAQYMQQRAANDNAQQSANDNEAPEELEEAA